MGDQVARKDEIQILGSSFKMEELLQLKKEVKVDIKQVSALKE
jgi:hypothetical protein